MRRPRDSKKSKVYQAEEAAFPGRLHNEEMTILQAQRYVTKVWGWSLGYGTPPTVKHQRQGSAWGGPWVISVSAGCRNKVVLLHEMAHSCNDRASHTQKQGHGPEWAGLFLHLVRRELGKADFTRLAREFEARGVDYHLVK